MTPLLYVGAGGALGAMARFLMAGWVQKASGGTFPWGTLSVNVAGAFAMGLVVAVALKAASFPADLRVFLTSGVLGGFTTFSAFSVETALMIEKGDLLPAGLYVAASVTLTVLFLFCGLWLVRSIAA
ncbi:MAG: fluoride efflux transporter CrcB [Alphaproteobacteria bacterium]